MIYVRSGWVRVVYEDQGEPFVMHAGDLVLQPPEIRHRVLESSAGFEVVEVGCPALHPTLADHEMKLPNRLGDPERSFSGQRFLRHIAADTPWTPYLTGEAQETEIHEATGGLAQVRTIRTTGAPLDFPPHGGELAFGFVLDGTARLGCQGDYPLGPADSFVIPPSEPWTIGGASDDFRLLHVTTAALD
jgi:quercetin dioxygenase-like cupin family protein